MPGILESFAALLRCPLTGQQLRLATPAEFRALIANEQANSSTADGFLVREDGTAAYPVRDGIPSLLPESVLLMEDS